MTRSLAPVEPPFPESLARLLDAYPKQDGYLLSLFRVFANSERFLRKGVPNLLDKDSPLDLRSREIVILRVTGNLNCAYEWGVHAAIFARAAKLTGEQVAATRLGPPDAPCWNGREAALLAAIDSLCRSGTLDDALLAAFRRDWNPGEQLEILALCGAYSTISFVANVSRLPPETFASPFPEPA